MLCDFPANHSSRDETAGYLRRRWCHYSCVSTYSTNSVVGSDGDAVRETCLGITASPTRLVVHIPSESGGGNRPCRGSMTRGLPFEATRTGQDDNRGGDNGMRSSKEMFRYSRARQWEQHWSFSSRPAGLIGRRSGGYSTRCTPSAGAGQRALFWFLHSPSCDLV